MVVALLVFLAIAAFQYFPYLVAFSTPLLSIYCGKDALLSLSLIFIIYFNISNLLNILLQDISWLLLFGAQAILGCLLLAVSPTVVPIWLLSLYSIVIHVSSVLWLAAESLALFHLISQFSKVFISQFDNELWGVVTKGSFIAITVIACGASGFAMYVLIEGGLQWYGMGILLIGVVSFYFMYHKEEGNAMDASALLLASLAMLYLTVPELGYYSHIKSSTHHITTSNRCDLLESSLASWLWYCISNLPVTYGMWSNVINPVTALSAMLKVLFVIFYVSYKNKEQRPDHVYGEQPEANGIWRWLSEHKLYYQTMILLMITHAVYQYLPELSNDLDPDNLSSLFPNWTFSHQTHIVISRFFQSSLLQLLYIYSLYDADDAGDAGDSD